MPKADLEHPLVQMRDVWTFEDLQSLDVEDSHRYEIVDGALLVSPTADWAHEFTIGRVHRALLSVAPLSIEVLSGNLGIRFDRSYRVLDVVVVPTSAFADASDWYRPRDLRLVVEVVSPGSVTTDRVTKPAQYAAAGIPNFWRVERDPVSLTAYALAPGASVYTEVGSWGAGQTARLSDPFPVEVEVDRLV